MRISSKVRYGIIFVLELALRERGRNGAVTLHEVAARNGLSEKYLWQVITPLRAAGMVRTVRGAGGGYVLARRQEELTIADLVHVLEGGEPVGEETSAAAAGAIEQVAQSAWREVQARVTSVMADFSIAELSRRCRVREREMDPEYMI